MIMDSLGADFKKHHDYYIKKYKDALTWKNSFGASITEAKVASRWLQSELEKT